MVWMSLQTLDNLTALVCFVVCVQEKPDPMRQVVAAGCAHLTHWAWSAGWGAPWCRCCLPARPGTSMCLRRPSLRPWWNSCHQRPGAGGLGPEQCPVCFWTSDTSALSWSWTWLCTAATHSRRGGRLTPEATQTHWPSKPLQQHTNTLKCLLFSDRHTILQCMCIRWVPSDVFTCTTYADAPVIEKPHSEHNSTVCVSGVRGSTDHWFLLIWPVTQTKTLTFLKWNCTL